jgi:hypothetical protein
MHHARIEVNYTRVPGGIAYRNAMQTKQAFISNAAG